MTDAFGFPTGKASPDPVGGQADLTGHGRSSHGLINVIVSSEGRVAELRIDPRALRSRSVTDSAGLADEIKSAVNAALDDLDRQVEEITGEVAGALEKDLDELASGFERALEQMATDIARAHRRLED